MLSVVKMRNGKPAILVFDKKQQKVVKLSPTKIQDELTETSPQLQAKSNLLIAAFFEQLKGESDEEPSSRTQSKPANRTRSKPAIQASDSVPQAISISPHTAEIERLQNQLLVLHNQVTDLKSQVSELSTKVDNINKDFSAKTTTQMLPVSPYSPVTPWIMPYPTTHLTPHSPVESAPKQSRYSKYSPTRSPSRHLQKTSHYSCSPSPDRKSRKHLRH